jgi:hypothetical protein
LAGGDHGVQVSEDRGGDDALRLIRSNLVVFSAGQVPVAGAEIFYIATIPRIRDTQAAAALRIVGPTQLGDLTPQPADLEASSHVVPAPAPVSISA